MPLILDLLHGNPEPPNPTAFSFNSGYTQRVNVIATEIMPKMELRLYGSDGYMYRYQAIELGGENLDRVAKIACLWFGITRMEDEHLVEELLKRGESNSKLKLLDGSMFRLELCGAEPLIFEKDIGNIGKKQESSIRITNSFENMSGTSVSEGEELEELRRTDWILDAFVRSTFAALLDVTLNGTVETKYERLR